jgi:hypothetical protein
MQVEKFIAECNEGLFLLQTKVVILIRAKRNIAIKKGTWSIKVTVFRGYRHVRFIHNYHVIIYLHFKNNLYIYYLYY